MPKARVIANDNKQYNLSEAQQYLRREDKTMGRLIDLVGPTEVRSEQELSVFQSLVRAIAYQMISTKAAAAIHGRLLGSCAGEVTPEKLLKLEEQDIRDLGYSRAKAASLLDLAHKCATGVVPQDHLLDEMSDKELVQCLTQVRGIGAWSVEMLMIFNLRRPNVFPATDLGVRRGHMLSYDLPEMLTAKALLLASDRWQPYRSVAAWYLWRANDCVDWDKAAESGSGSTQRKKAAKATAAKSKKAPGSK